MPPEWITLFPKGGQIATRDGRVYDIDVRGLMSSFNADALEIPVDINHSTDVGMFGSGRSDAVGWVTELRITPAGGLEGRVDWLAEGKAILAARSYRYTSPSFYRDQLGKATRLKAVALVTAPALARQPALASATPISQTTETVSMDKIAEALGLKVGAGEAECLSALSALRTGMVAKSEHEQVTAQLAAATTQLSAASSQLETLNAATRTARVDGLIEAALSAKKIIPAEKDAYVALCATDDGLTTVEKLMANKTALLAASGLDERRQPGEALDLSDGVKLGAAAQRYMSEQASKGITISAADAVDHLTATGAQA